MRIVINGTKKTAGESTASGGAAFIKVVIEERSSACITVAKGASLFEILSSLVVQELNFCRSTALSR